MKINYPAFAGAFCFASGKKTEKALQSSRLLPSLFGIRQKIFLIALAVTFFASCQKDDSSNNNASATSPSGKKTNATISAFGPSTMYTTTSEDWDPGALYARAVELNYSGANNGKMYATFERYNAARSFPIYESTNGGATWAKISDLTDQANGWGMVFQPQLYELPQQIGTMPAGTLICAGVSCPADYSQTKIDMYKSNDLGRNWSFVGSIATGGAANSNGTADPVWEPFFLVANNKLICYYSDETDPAHNQKIVHKTTTDGSSWSGVVNDVALGTTLRPGMPTLAKMANGQYIMTYEIVNAAGTPTHYKISANPESWNPSNSGTKINNGGSPYIVALSSGKLVMNNHNSGNVYTNVTNGTGTWTTVSTPMGLAYSRGLVPLSNGELFIISGGYLTTRNNVTYASMAIGNYCKFVNRANGKCIDNYGIFSNGANVVQYASGGSPNQQWQIQGAGDGYSKLFCRTGGSYLDNMDRTADGGIVGQWVGNPSFNQQWQIADAGSGYVKIINRVTGKCVDNGNETADGAPMKMYYNNASLNQQWQKVPIN